MRSKRNAVTGVPFQLLSLLHPFSAFPPSSSLCIPPGQCQQCGLAHRTASVPLPLLHPHSYPLSPHTPLLLLLVVPPNGAAAACIPLLPPWSAFAPALIQGKLQRIAGPSFSLPDPPPTGRRRDSVGVEGVEIRRGPSLVVAVSVS